MITYACFLVTLPLTPKPLLRNKRLDPDLDPDPDLGVEQMRKYCYDRTYL